MDEAIKERVLHLYIVEKLSARQIALRLNIGRKAAAGVINSNIAPKTEFRKVSNLDQYKPLKRNKNG